jgi:predicted metalloprotease with PDZ domain
MRLLKRKAEITEQVLSDRSLASFLAGFAGAGVIADMRDYVESGKTIPLPPGALGPCFQIEKKAIHKFDAGFDIDTIYRTGIIQGVKQESEAYKAGLRDGQTVTRSSTIDPNDPNQAIEMTVIDSGLPKRIRYFPRSDSSDIDQYEFVAGTEHRCD